MPDSQIHLFTQMHNVVDPADTHLELLLPIYSALEDKAASPSVFATAIQLNRVTSLPYSVLGGGIPLYIQKLPAGDFSTLKVLFNALGSTHSTSGPDDGCFRMACFLTSSLALYERYNYTQMPENLKMHSPVLENAYERLYVIGLRCNLISADLTYAAECLLDTIRSQDESDSLESYDRFVA